MDQRSDERKGEARSGGSSDAESFDPKVDLRVDAKIDPRVNAAASDSTGESSADSTFDPMTDPMAPPREPCECWCMHCERTFMSNEMWFQRVVGAKDSFPGFWMCPTPNCSGAGFSFDIFPTDPDHPSNEGWHYSDDGYDEEEFEDEEIEALIEGDAADRDAVWNPEEPKYKELDELAGEDDDISGEEWKYGLEPGALRPGSWSDEARAEWEEEQRKYDQPDERPRVLDWSNMPERGNGASINEDDIPF